MQTLNLSINLLASLISICIKRRHLKLGASFHSLLLKTALSSHLLLSNRLFHLYSKCNSLPDALKAFHDLPFRDTLSWNTLLAAHSRAGFLTHARNLFDKMPHPNVVSYNTLISAFSHHGLYSESFNIFRQMIKEFELLVFDEFSLVSIVGVCACLGGLTLLRQVHGAAIVIGLEFNLIVCNALIDAYGKCGEPGVSYSIFSQMKEKDVVSWTSMVVAYGQASKLDDAFRLFSCMPVRNVHSWTALITAFAKGKCGNEALDLFHQMVEEKITLNSFTFVGVLTACADLALITKGKQIHGRIIRSSSSSSIHLLNLYVFNALIDMYSKCGDMKLATKLFNSVLEKDVVSWNSLITGFAQNGLRKEALVTFRRMIEEGMRPNEVTLLGALSACSHTGFSSEGLHILESMEKCYGIKPSLDHYAALIDVLGRENRLAEAMDLMDKAPNGTKHVGMWGAILGACRVYGDMELAIRAAEALFEMEPDNGGRYVMLSNVFAAGNRWKDSHNVRKLMEERGFEKEVAYSWIEVRNVRHKFVAKDKSHTQMDEIYEIMFTLLDHMKSFGFMTF